MKLRSLKCGILIVYLLKTNTISKISINMSDLTEYIKSSLFLSVSVILYANLVD